MLITQRAYLWEINEFLRKTFKLLSQIYSPYVWLKAVTGNGILETLA